MLNAVCETKLKSVDYKSIALPAELQGLLFSSLIFSSKGQINQCIKRLALMLTAVAAWRYAKHYILSKKSF